MRERLVVAEEEAFVGGHRLDHVTYQHLGRRAPQALRQRIQISQLFPLDQPPEPGFQQVDLVLADDQPGARLQQGGERFEGIVGQGGTHVRAIRSISSSFGAMRGSGSTAWQSPAWATAPGMPQTTLVASSWAIAPPPALMTALVPASPSCPMPVSIATSTRPPHATAALRSIGSTDGRQKFSGGSLDSRARSAVPAASMCR